MLTSLTALLRIRLSSSAVDADLVLPRDKLATCACGPLSVTDSDVQVRDGRVTSAIGSLDTDHVMAGLGVLVHGARVSILGQRHGVTIALHGDLRAAIAKIPGLLAVGGAESSH
jgi:hypothetical protein